MAWHSYEFYEKRKNDPKWKNAWIKVENYRKAYERKVRRDTIIRSIILLLIISQLVIIIGLGIEFLYDYSVHKITLEIIMTFLGYVKTEYQQGLHYIWKFMRIKLMD